MVTMHNHCTHLVALAMLGSSIGSAVTILLVALGQVEQVAVLALSLHRAGAGTVQIILAS